MDVEDQNTKIFEFFESAHDLMVEKGPDYAPHDVAFLEVIKTAFELGSSPERVLYTHLKKHVSAILAYVIHGTTKSETIVSRLRDLANFAALLCVFIENRGKIYSSVYDYLLSAPCESENPFNPADRVLPLSDCDVCRMSQWLRIRYTQFGYPSESWPWTQKRPACSHGETVGT